MALHWGDVAAMDGETFERKTGLELLDAEGALKSAEGLPAMNTFPEPDARLAHRGSKRPVQGLRGVLAGILERAAAAGALDRGLEDIDADDVSVLDEETVRTDAATGAETKLIRFAIRTRGELVGQTTRCAVWPRPR